LFARLACFVCFQARFDRLQLAGCTQPSGCLQRKQYQRVVENKGKTEENYYLARRDYTKSTTDKITNIS
jgi:hypothetical protein